MKPKKKAWEQFFALDGEIEKLTAIHFKRHHSYFSFLLGYSGSQMSQFCTIKAHFEKRRGFYWVKHKLKTKTVMDMPNWPLLKLFDYY